VVPVAVGHIAAAAEDILVVPAIIIDNITYLPAILGTEVKAQILNGQGWERVKLLLVKLAASITTAMVDQAIVVRAIHAPALMEAVADMFIPLLPTAVPIQTAPVRNGFPRYARE
jgi:hypothetical protein